MNGRAWLVPLVLGMSNVLVLTWILTDDPFTPFCPHRDRGPDETHSRIVQSHLDRERAVRMYKMLREFIPEVAARRARAELFLRQEERRLAQARTIVEAHVEQRAHVRRCLSENRPVATLSGRIPSRPELQAFVTKMDRRLESTRREVAAHEELCRKRRADLDRLRLQTKEIATTLESLQAGLSAQIERGLEPAYPEIETRIAGVEAILAFTSAANSILEQGDEHDENLLESLSSLLGEPGRSLGELVIR